MKNVFVILISIVLAFTSCVSKNKKGETASGTHKVVVKEVLQANAYTYLNVIENEKEQWIAVPKMEANEGDVYYFDGFMEMNNFESKDLNRTFESVYFIQELNAEASHEGHNHGAMDGMPAGHPNLSQKHEGKPDINKKEINVAPVEGGITLEELFSNTEKYNGKKVVVRGEVVKANFEIMNKNWFHIQDGTASGDKFDLTITSLEKELKVGDLVTFEGTIVLDKDFGYGYAYEVLLEDAVAKN